MENGWQGGPPETNSTRPSHCRKSTDRTSLTKSSRSEPIACFQFSRSVRHESSSRSTTATGRNPAPCSPSASPPPPANSSIVSMHPHLTASRNGCKHSLQFANNALGILQRVLPDAMHSPTESAENPPDL